MDFSDEKNFLKNLPAAAAQEALFAQTFSIRASEADAYREVHTDVLFSLLQEVAYRHVSLLGLDGHHNGRGPREYAWLVNRISLRLARGPRWLEPLKIYTWQSALDRLGFSRDFYLFAADGSPYGAAASYWTLVTPDEHRLLKPQSLLPDGENPYQLPYKALPNLPLRLRPGFADFSGAVRSERRIGASDIDYNQHLNNTRYIALCCDTADLLDPPGRLRRVDINFVAEMFKGETACVEAVPFTAANPAGDPAGAGAAAAAFSDSAALVALRCPGPRGDRFRALLGFA